MSHNDNTLAYVGIKECGCVIAAMVDDGKHPDDLKEFLHELVDDGLTIEHKTVEWVRDNWGKCKKHSELEQERLF